MNKNQKWEISKIQKHAEQNALKFVKESAEAITKSINREYKYIIKQFLNFREETWKILKTLKDHS